MAKKTATAPAATEKRVRNGREAFLTAYMECKGNVKAIAARLGITENSVTVRKSSLNTALEAKGKPRLPQFPRAGGGGKADVDLDDVASFVGKFVEPAVDPAAAEAAETVAAG